MIKVRATTLDSLLAEETVRVDDLGLVWMDTQGHEPYILRGAQSLLASSIPVLIEYWPYGLDRVDGRGLLESIIREHYTHFVDMGEAEDNVSLRSTAEISGLSNTYTGTSYTDLLLLKQ